MRGDTTKEDLPRLVEAHLAPDAFSPADSSISRQETPRHQGFGGMGGNAKRRARE
jgi:hypothetical protein